MNGHSRISRRARPSHSSAGFTLIELLVALTLLGLMSVFLFGSFRFGTRVWEASSRRIEQIGQVDAVQTMLRHELGQAKGMTLERPGSQPEPTFAGSSTALRFAAPLPTHLGVGGYYLFWLTSDETQSNGELVLRRRIYRPDTSPADDESDETVVLLRGVANLSFEYYGQASEDAEPAWQQAWESHEALPDLIRIDVGFAGDGREWPLFVVAPRVRTMRP
jgi:general secretion pathway protein J